MAFEALLLLILMLSIVLKSNVLSLIYLIFVIKFLTSSKKTSILVHLVVFISITLVAQYSLLVLNLTDRISPVPVPSQLHKYPNNPNDLEDLSIKYLFPLFFRYEVFRDLRLSYLIGITIEQKQIQNLFLDFLNLYLISIYIYHYRNPVLFKSVHKIFWRFPANFETKDAWSRLD